MPIDFNQSPYFDDFNKDNLYYRLLFQPGRAVQARELTQIQSLLQSQIESLGRHMFKDGSLVYGGQINYDRTDTKWLAVKPQDPSGNPVRTKDIYPGLKIKKPSDSASTDAQYEGTITGVVPREAADPDTIYFKWFPNSPENPDSEGFQAGEHLFICDPVTGAVKYKVTAMNTNSAGVNQHYGTSSSISVKPGIYFWNGHFIKSNGGSIRLSKYSNTTTYRVGYVVSEEIVSTDPRSLDPAAHSSNHSAPGADRYKISMELIKVGNGLTLDESTIPNFIEIARIESGNFLGSSSDMGEGIYNVLADQLARRTYEESGNYIVQGYDLSLKNLTTSDNPKMLGRMSKGVSYVKGYRNTLNEFVPIRIDKGRDVIQEDSNIANKYGDNFVLVYDEENLSQAHPENANGLFVIGSGAGSYTSSDYYGQRGAAVTVHCVPQQLVKDHGLTDDLTWNSTKVGTARPIQMVYNKTRTAESNEVGRQGSVYSLWLADFKSSPISNTVSVANRIENVSASANASHAEFHFSSTTNGITANDRISVVGEIASPWSLDKYQVNYANATAVVVSHAGLDSATPPPSGTLTIHRTTGNNSVYRTVVLDTDSSAAWNGSYVGATIVVGNNTPRTIVDYIGTDSGAESLYANEYGYSKRGMAVVDKDFSELPKYGDAYTLNLGMKQARSVLYNQEISATGEDLYPAVLNQSWNIDPIGGVLGGNRDLLNSDVYGGRIDGDTSYNLWGEDPEGEDSLLFPVGRSAVKSVMTHGNMDVSLSSNTIIDYIEYATSTASSTGSTLVFASASGGSDYKYFDRPDDYPFGSTGTTTMTNSEQIRENYILVDRTTGQVLSKAITQVRVVHATHQITITSSVNFTNGRTYVLLFPVRANFASPAYKKLIKGNKLSSATAAAVEITDFDNGHILLANASYGRTAGSRYSLKKPDGYKLQKVVHMVKNNQANTDLANTILDITDRFEFDTGQRDMFYDNASIVLKENVNPPTGNVLVVFDYFQRMDKPKSDSTRAEDLNSPSYFSVDSYQYTTDLTLDHSPSQAAFTTGMQISSNSNVTGYVLDFANTSGGGAYSKIRLQDVAGPKNTTPTFTVGEYITAYSGSDTIAGRILSVTTADLKYSEIPTYKSRSKVAYPLRNMIDLRAYVSTNNRTSDTISNSIMPAIPTRSAFGAGQVDATGDGAPNPISTALRFDHFAGRIDKVVVTAEGDYTTIKGTPAVNPFPPKDADDDSALTLFTLQIPPYTFDTRNVQIKENTARRHTMKDIGRLAKRVENLEYYVSLNALEKAAAEMEITFADGTSRFKNGIVVDNFTGQGVVDVRDNKSALGKGVLRPQQIWYQGSDESENEATVKFSPVSMSGVRKHDRNIASIDGEDNSTPASVLTLDYSTKPLITQGVATSAESVNPFDLQNFTGELRLTPDNDTWINTTIVPEYNSFVSGALDNLASVDENSTAQEIADAFKSMDDFWEDLAGSYSIGDDVEGTSFDNPDATLQTELVSRNITLGSSSAQYSSRIKLLDAAIASHGMTDGMVQNIKILPYMRSRDIIIHASGLKPNHLNALHFDNVGVEPYFSQANEIYMEYDPNTDTKFQPDVNGTYEKIKLSGGSKSANAILIATRELRYHNSDVTSGGRIYMVGYIVPEFNATTGKVDFANYKDGYYATGSWNNSDIAQYGFQGSAARTVTGYSSQAQASLITGGTEQYFNGHYTGTAQNSDANTTHIELSPDARRYIDANFRKSGSSHPPEAAMGKGTGFPLNSRIQIVAGAGAGQECVANGLIYTTDNIPVIELKAARGDNKTGLNEGIDSTSVYTIGMKHVNPDARAYGVTQIGDITARSNHYGEKIGILHLPSKSTVRFTNGTKQVEVFDRYSKEEWLISSYASGEYSSEGKSMDTTDSSVGISLDKLKAVRSKLNAFRINDHPEDLGYIPATNNSDGSEGKVAVVTGVTVANGTWTAKDTHDIDYIPGGGDFGTISITDQEFLATQLTGVWRDLQENHPEIYDRYYAQFGGARRVTDGNNE